jgi:hypothetical protein
VRLECHLASEAYEYGITFVSPSYIEQHWSHYFEIERVIRGAIHDFQDIVVLRRAADKAFSPLESAEPNEH